MTTVESFQLDHTQVKAPYVRLAGTESQDGATVSKYDLHLAQPNQDALSTASLHTLEHLLAGYMRERLDGIIDISPMGCRTGFYMVVWGTPTPEHVRDAFVHSLEQVVKTTTVPAQTAKECGNYQDHSLFGAIEYAKKVLELRVSADPFKWL